MLGITFKENCSDFRNKEIVDLIIALKDYGVTIDVYDPLANSDEIKYEYKIESANSSPTQRSGAVILGIVHQEFLKLDIPDLQKTNSVLSDIRGVLDSKVDGRL